MGGFLSFFERGEMFLVEKYFLIVNLSLFENSDYFIIKTKNYNRNVVRTFTCTILVGYQIIMREPF